MSELSIFTHALEIADPAERAAFLDLACSGDEALRRRVDRLLARHWAAGSFLERPAADLARAGNQRPADPVGTAIGPYKLLEAIGEGGMGTVYLAEQTEPVRRLVALKVIRSGLDSRQVVARFEAERQALALMDHPNIAKVLDAGATLDARPFFAMELVKGVPITRFCDERKLTARQRLELFASVCEAVQHAHQKGVIHRDIKPSNVLVALYDDRPIPKVIDFGVAKATGQQLTEKTLHTGFGAVVGTVEYMSPEQASFNQLDVDTRSDIYSLGVLLYELLAGSPPFSWKELEKAGLLEVLRVIREGEPPRPSTKLSTADGLPALAANRGTEPGRLAALLRGELDWIVMRALEKDRTRRYESASAFAADVRRYLSDEPVQACPPTLGYRARKFIRRNRPAVAAASAVLLALVMGIVGTTAGMLRARDAEESARGEAGKKETALVATVAALGRAETAEGETRLALQRERGARDAERQALAIQAVGIADREWHAGRPDKADQALDNCPPEYRHWEWHYRKRLCNQDLHRVVFPLRGSWVGAKGAFSPGGSAFASTTHGPGWEWKVWDTKTGRELLALPRGRTKNGCVAFSPDGRRIACSVTGTHCGIHDAATGRQLVHIEMLSGRPKPPSPLPARELVFSPDGNRLAIIHPGAVLAIHDAGSGECLVTFPRVAGGRSRPVFSPDGKRIAFASRDAKDEGPTASHIDIADAKTTATELTLRGHEGYIDGIAFSPDGKLLASGSRDGTVRVWDLAGEGKEVFRYVGHTGGVGVVRFSPRGDLVAYGCADGSVHVWETKERKELVAYRGHTGAAHTLEFSSDGTRLHSAGIDGTLRVWPVAPSRDPHFLPEGGRVAFSASGDRLAVMREERDARVPKGRLTVRLLDARTFAELRRWNREPYEPLQASPAYVDGRFLAVFATQPPTAVDVETGSPAPAKDSFPPVGGLGPGWRLKIGAQLDNQLTAGVRYSEMKLVSARTGETVTPLGRFAHPARAAFHPGGRWILLTSQDQSPRVLSAETGALLGTLPAPGPAFATTAFSPDGTLLVAGSNTINQVGDLALWDFEARKLIRSFDGHPQGIGVLAISPDNRRLASEGRDKTIKVWDVASGQELVSFPSGSAGVSQKMLFSPDGGLLVVQLGPFVRVFDGRPWQDTPGRVVDLSGGFRGRRPVPEGVEADLKDVPGKR